MFSLSGGKKKKVVKSENKFGKLFTTPVPWKLDSNFFFFWGKFKNTIWSLSELQWNQDIGIFLNFPFPLHIYTTYILPMLSTYLCYSLRNTASNAPNSAERILREKSPVKNWYLRCYCMCMRLWVIVVLYNETWSWNSRKEISMFKTHNMSSKW